MVNGDGANRLLGPFWRNELAPGRQRRKHRLVPDTPGEPLFVNARVQDGEGRPIAGAEVDIWHASPSACTSTKTRSKPR